MVSKYGIKKIKFLLFYIFIFSFIHSDFKPKKIESLAKFNKYYFLENGDLVCRLGNGYFSDFFKKYASKDKIYSHIGIIVLEKNIPYVIHSEASEFTGVGGIKKESIDVFLEGIQTYSFFKMNISQVEKNQIISKSNYYLNKHTKFDLNFDTNDDSEMYCTEFVAKCINQGMGKNIIQPTLKINDKYLFGLDDIYNNDIISIKKNLFLH